MSFMDERIVKMTFDNADFEHRASTTMGTLGDLDQGLRNLNGAQTADLSQSLADVSERFSAMGIVGMTVISNLTTAVMELTGNIAKMFLIDPITTGLEEYEEKMNNIQTTVVNMKSVYGSEEEAMKHTTETLDELNRYADKTIFKFSDMTAAMAKFTAAGVDLETTKNMIEGIGNIAGEAGISTEQASSAFYMLAQAVSAGKLSLYQYRTLENSGFANMKFKNELLETAAAMGKLQKNADGTYTAFTDAGKAVEVTAENLRNTLTNTGWADRDVMEMIFGRYASKDATWELNQNVLEAAAAAGTITKTADGLYKALDGTQITQDNITTYLPNAFADISEEAFHAAQDIKTFSQLVDTLGEAVQSGWAKNWEYIFGDFLEAKKLWGAINEYIAGEGQFDELGNYIDGTGGILTRITETQAQILKQWHDGGGRNFFFEGLKNIWHICESIVSSTIGSFFKGLIGDFNSLAAGSSLTSISERFADITSKIGFSEDALKSISNVFEFLGSIVSKVIGILKEFVQIMAVGIYGISDFVDTIIGGMAPALESVKNAITGVKDVEETLSDSKGVNAISTAFGELGKVFKTAGESAKTASSGINSLATSLKKGFTQFLNNNGLEFGAGIVGFVALLKLVKKPLDGLKASADNLINIKDNITKPLGAISEACEKVTESVEVNSILKISAALGILAISLVALSTIDAEGLAVGLAGLAAAMKILTGAYAVIASTFLNPSSGIAGIVGTIKASMAGLAAAGSATILIALAGSILILSTSLMLLSNIPGEKIAVGLGAMAAMMAGLEVLMKATISVNKINLIATAGYFIAIAMALDLMAVAVTSLGRLNLAELGKGLAAVAIGMSLLAQFSSKIGGFKSLQIGVGTGLAIMEVSIALIALAEAVKLFGSLDLLTLGKGLGATAAALAIFVGAFRLMSASALQMIGGATAIAIMSVALMALTAPIAILSAINFWSLVKALGALAVALGVLFAAGVLMADPMFLVAGASIAVMAAAISLLVPAIAAMGVLPVPVIVTGILALAGALAVLIGAAAIVNVTGMSAALIALAGSFALVGIGVAGIGVGLSLALSAIMVAGAALSSILENVCTALISSKDLIGETLVSLLDVVLSTLTESWDVIIGTLGSFIVRLLDDIIKNAGKIIDKVTLAIVAIVDALVGNLPLLVQAAFDLVLGFVESFTQTLSDNKQRLADDLTNLLAVLVDVIWTTITTIITELPIKIAEIFTTCINKISTSIPDMKTAVKKVFDAIKDVFKNIKDTFVEVGKNVVSGIIKGLKDGSGLTKLGEGAKTVATFLSDAINKGLKIHSPSRVMMETGKYVVLGLAEGLTGNVKIIDNAATKTADAAKKSFTTAFENMYDAINSSIDVNPVIKPVLDLSDLQNGSKQLNNLLNGNTMTARLGSIAVRDVEAESYNGDKGSAGSTTYIQNNYSPKALSPIEIYRNTKNQISMAKGV